MAKKHEIKDRDIQETPTKVNKEKKSPPTPQKKKSAAKNTLSVKEFCGLKGVLPRFQFVAESKFKVLGRKTVKEWTELFEKEKVPC